MCGLFKNVVKDGDFTQGYRKKIWSKIKKYTNYAFVVYDTNNQYICSIDPIQEVFRVGNRVFVTNDAYTYEESIDNLQGLTCYVEEAHYNYENENMNYTEIEI